MSDREQIIQEKEQQIATLQAEVERLKTVLPEPPVDSIVYASRLGDDPVIFYRTGDDKERNWFTVFGNFNAASARGSMRTTWLSIVETYPELYVAKWERLGPSV